MKENAVNSKTVGFHLPGRGSLTLPAMLLSTPAFIKDFIDVINGHAVNDHETQRA